MDTLTLDQLHQALKRACTLCATVTRQAAKEAAIHAAEIEAHDQARATAAQAITQPLPQHKR